MLARLYLACSQICIRSVIFRLASVAIVAASGLHSSAAPAVRLSTWYWLNAAPRSEWAHDFQHIRALGFTDVLLVWGLDAAAFSFRVPDSQAAIRQAYAAGLHSYLFVWHARHNSLDHRPEYEQVDLNGHHLFAFDTFNPEWRHGPWKAYLQTLAQNYGPEPGLAGYVLDNSFALGRIGSIDGPAPAEAEGYLSYGEMERRLWKSEPPRSVSDKDWGRWTAQRSAWWADWARETVADLRAMDHNPGHEVLLEDGDNAIDPDTLARAGVDFRQVAQAFDPVGAYFAPAYSDAAVDSQLETLVQNYLRRMQAAAGRGKVALSLRLSEGNKEDTPGVAKYPTLQQIRRIVDAATALGIRHFDFYGYRMGVYHLDAAGWEHYRPGSSPDYPLTGEIQGKFLKDRPDLWSGLQAYFAQLQKAGSQ